MRTPLLRLTIVLALALAMNMPGPSDAVEPCCAITAIDAKTQMVTARETRTGRTFQFKVAEAKALAVLKVGQPVQADFNTMQVSLNPDGVSPCCALVNLRPPASPTR